MLLLTKGCGQADPPLRVGLLVWPPYELAFLAHHEGWIDSERLQLVEYQSPAELKRAFRNELLDVAFVTTQMSLRLAQEGADHRIIYAIDSSHGSDAVIARRYLRTPEDLRGARIGVEPTALGAYMLHRTLARADLSERDVDLIPLDVPRQAEEWHRGNLDAVVCYEPVCTHVRDAEGGNLFDSSRIPGEILDVVVTRPQVIDERDDALQELVTGLVRAHERLDEVPERSAAVMAPRTSLSTREFLKTLEGTELFDATTNRELLAEDAPKLKPLLQTQAAFMEERGLLKDTVTVRPLIDGRFLCEECTP